ncbi:DMT family transporter [Pseudoroseomonas ludipueritiae]|nr:DMT family transporter [Pseudoroseomonas ludipueritiae]
MLLALAGLWGGSFFFNAVAVRDLPPFTLVWLRVATAAATLLLVLRLLRQRMPGGGRVWAAFFSMGLLNNGLPFALIVWSQQHVASGLAAILNATTPLFTVLAAHLLTPDEKLNSSKVAGVILGFIGAAMMIGPDALGGLGASMGAQLACLAAALSYALAGIFGRRFKNMGVPPLAAATGQVCASTTLLLPLVLLVDQPWMLPFPRPVTWAAVLGLGMLCTALAYVLYFRILATAGATNLLLVTFLVPVSAILLGWLVLGETLQHRHFGGLALIGLGLACLDGRLPGLLAGSGRQGDCHGSDPGG